MMIRQQIRPACGDDVKALARIKCLYVQSLYRGFLSADYLKGLNEASYLEQVSAWVDGGVQVQVLEKDNEAAGFVVYGTDPEDAGYGLIHDVCVLPDGGWQDKDLLIRTCLDDLAHQHDLVRVRTVRDNFSARFLFERFGFRADGTQSVHMVEDCELSVVRLVGRTRKQEA